MQYGYDGLNRLTSVTDWLLRTTAYTYDAAGRLIATVNPNTTRAAYAYDTVGRLTGLANTKGDATVISSYTYTLDAIGNHTQVVQDEPLLPNIPGQNLTYTYDAENRMTDAGGISNTFDANGNMTVRGSDTFTYDYNDRLIQSNIEGVATQYRYDGMGNRLVKAAGGTTTRYVQDINGSLSNVLAETSADGTITTHYVYGLGLISRILPNGTAYYYHYDSRGSTVALTDAGENITDVYAYDPFGRLANSSGSTANPFRYVGRYGVMEEGNGLQYIRARYYIPELGRFITKDPLTGKDGDSQSLNRYQYANGNPIIFVDPSGLFSWATFETGVRQIILGGVKATSGSIGMIVGGSMVTEGGAAIATGPGILVGVPLIAGGALLAGLSVNKVIEGGTQVGSGIYNIVNAFKDKPAVDATISPVSYFIDKIPDERLREAVQNSYFLEEPMITLLLSPPAGILSLIGLLEKALISVEKLKSSFPSIEEVEASTGLNSFSESIPTGQIIKRVNSSNGINTPIIPEIREVKSIGIIPSTKK